MFLEDWVKWQHVFLEKVTGPVPGAHCKGQRAMKYLGCLSELCGAAQAVQQQALGWAAGMELLSRLICAPYSLP